MLEKMNASLIFIFIFLVRGAMFLKRIDDGFDANFFGTDGPPTGPNCYHCTNVQSKGQKLTAEILKKSCGQEKCKDKSYKCAKKVGE